MNDPSEVDWINKEQEKAREAENLLNEATGI